MANPRPACGLGFALPARPAVPAVIRFAVNTVRSDHLGRARSGALIWRTRHYRRDGPKKLMGPGEQR